VVATTLWISVRHSSHWGESLQNGLRDEWTCGTTLALAYVLPICCMVTTLDDRKKSKIEVSKY